MTARKVVGNERIELQQGGDITRLAVDAHRFRLF